MDGAADPQAAWLAYEDTHRDVFAVYYSDWGAPTHRAAAAATFSEVAPTISGRERRALELIDRALSETTWAGLLAGTQISVVLMVGHHTSNGWVAEFHGEPTLFLALEFLGDPPADDVLIVHELGHLIHQLIGAPWARIEQQTVAEQLFFEGLAVAVSRRLRPGYDESIYYWFDEVHPTWADACARSAPEAARRLRAELDSTSSAIRHNYFALPTTPLQWPPRIGYWFGDRLCTQLLRDHAFADLIRLDQASVRELARRHLNDI